MPFRSPRRLRAFLARTSRRPGMPIVGVTAGMLLTVWGGAAWLEGERRSELTSNELAHLERATRPLATSLASLLDTSDSMLRRVQGSPRRDALDDAALRQIVAESGVSAAWFHSLILLDVDGRARAEYFAPDPGLSPIGRRRYDDRPYYLVHRNATEREVEAGQAGGPFVGEFYIGRRSGRLLMPVSRRLATPDGRFAGVVVVNLRAEKLATVVRGLHAGEGASVGFAGTDGVIRLRTDSDGRLRQGERIPSEASPMQRFARGVESDRWVAESLVDPGVTRLYAVRRVEGYPLYAFVARGREAVLAENRRGAVAVVAAASVLSLAVLAVAGVAWRVTLRQRRLVHRLAMGERVARSGERAKSDFLASISHELRTPLTGILGYSQLIELRSADVRARPLAATIRLSAERMRALLDEVLDAARIDAGAMSVASVPARLGPLVDEVVTLFRPAVEAKGLALAVAAGSGADMPVRCDPQRLRQVVGHLLGNAVKFTDRGTITVRYSVGDGRGCIEVVDTGPGVGPALRAAIFQRYRQGGSNVAHQHGGTGLGLALSREFARLMGGDLVLHEQVAGEGARFEVCLPAWIDSPAATPGAGRRNGGQPAASPASSCSMVSMSSSGENGLVR